jgi:hypothetical protein
LVTISSALCLFLGIPQSSIRPYSHTSGRITFQGADHWYFNTIHESNAGTATLQAGITNAFIGVSNDLSSNGITTIDVNHKTGIQIASTASSLDLSHVTVINEDHPGDLTILSQQGFQTITGTTGNDVFAVTAHDSVIDGGGGNDIFSVNTTITYYNTFHESNGGTATLQAGINGAYIGFHGNFSAASSGVDAINANGHSGVTIGDDTTGATLDFSAVSVNVGAIVDNYSNTTMIFTDGNHAITASGTNDTFEFYASPTAQVPGSFGAETITGFHAGNAAGHDVIDLSHAVAPGDFNTLMQHATNDAQGNAVISLVDGNSITLTGVNTSSLTAADFSLNTSAPAGAHITDQTANTGHSYSLDVSGQFTSPEAGDPLTYSASLPTGLAIDAHSGIISGTPVNGDLGSNLISVTATDAYNKSFTETFALNVGNQPFAVLGSATENDTFLMDAHSGTTTVTGAASWTDTIDLHNAGNISFDVTVFDASNHALQSWTGLIGDGTAQSNHDLNLAQGDHALVNVTHLDGSGNDHLTLQLIDHIKY